MSDTSLTLRDRLALGVQRGVGRVASPAWIPAVSAIQQFGMGWSIENLDQVRADYARIRATSNEPLLLCANHLTLVDSAIVGWALGSTRFYLWDYAALPWNLPEQQNFGGNLVNKLLIYLMKCVPITRGSKREDLGLALSKITWLMKNGETALIFPEGGRSRTGRVDLEAGTYGAGRIFNAVPGCRVLCVYLRGLHQKTYSDFPARGEHFDVQIDCFQPRSDRRGLRASVEVSQQILERLAMLESRYLDAKPTSA